MRNARPIGAGILKNYFMEISQFKIAEEVYRKKEDLKEQLNNLEAGAWGLGIKIEVKTGYSDMGRDFTRTIELKGDIGIEACSAIKEVILKSLEALDKEFKEL